ncbi:putative PurR-regulated permease PerM [Pelomonas saccharophila]|uniref:PurR-regulated permease PerM n=1 Tax=Roseateles saccharophilus TaxID=304 RepID=A0ABU1YFM7_ROSSA|nr:AI-2E family transporter [Roseateles saccharophilus]MDR7267644.1 putative PurR-regulated permease PerM [Roseateles saccharophilus]
MMKLTKPQRTALAWGGVALALILLLWLLSPVLAPFIAALVLAYALAPVVQALVNRRAPRAVAVLMVEMLFAMALLALMLLVLPILSKELPALREQIPALAKLANDKVSPWLAEHGIYMQLDPASIKAFVLKYLDANFEEWLATVLSSARIGGSFLLAFIGNAVLLPVVLFYLLNDWPSLVERMRALVPPAARDSVGGFLDECDLTLGQYLRGQLLVMGALAIYYSVGLALARFDLALPIGVFTGLAVFIPYLGFGLGLVLALLAGLLQFASLYGVVAVAIVFGVGQLLESFVLTPRFVGERIGMSPLMVIFALLAFGHLLGFVGVLIALPLSAVAAVAVKRLHKAYLASSLFR